MHTQGVHVAVQYNGKPYALAIEELEPERSCRLFDTGRPARRTEHSPVVGITSLAVELVVDLQGLTNVETAPAPMLEIPFNHQEGTVVNVEPRSSVLLHCQVQSPAVVDFSLGVSVVVGFAMCSC